MSQNPALVRDIIREEANGYSVRFYRELPNGTFKEVWLRVDADLRVDENGELVYAGARDSDGDGKRELWGALVEKAYACFKDAYGDADEKGYDGIGSGGHSDDAFEAILGVTAKRSPVPASDGQLEELLAGVEDGGSVVVATRQDVGAGWIANHAYTVVGTYVEDGVLHGRPPQPASQDEPAESVNQDGSNDGVFAVPLEQVRENTETVYSAPPKPIGRDHASMIQELVRLGR